MTIVAGFLSSDVMLLCADKEEGDGYSKKEVKKIVHCEGNGWQADVGGAGPAAVLDLAFSKLKKEFLSCANRDELAAQHEEMIRSVLLDIHERYVWPSKVKNYETELLIGINFKDSGFCLYRTQEYIPQPIDSYSCIGIGAVLGNYFASLLHSPSLTRTQMICAGAFIVREVRDFVSDCGRGTQIEVAMKDGRHFSLHEQEMEFFLMLPERSYIADRIWDAFEPWEYSDAHIRSWQNNESPPDGGIQTMVWKDFDKFPHLQRATEKLDG
jgi:hypothetical protein